MRKIDIRTPRTVQREIDCDTGKLYGPLSEAITYLKAIQAKHPEAALTEKWTGYETTEMVFQYPDLETPKEVEMRALEHERKLQREKEATEKARDHAAKFAQFNKLKRELGMN